MKMFNFTGEVFFNFSDTFTHLHQLEAAERKSKMEQLRKWWDEYIFRHRKGPITEQEFIDMQNEDFKADREKYRQRIASAMHSIFNMLDISHDGSSTKEDFIIAFRSFGHENIAFYTEFFNSYNPVDGKVSMKNLIDSWVHFITCEDSSIPDIVKEAFDKGV